VEVSDVFFGTKGTGNKEKKGPDVRVVTSRTRQVGCSHIGPIRILEEKLKLASENMTWS
jgi:hypothetical protein